MKKGFFIFVIIVIIFISGCSHITERNFLLIYSSDGGFFGSSILIDINGDGTFEVREGSERKFPDSVSRKGKLSNENLKIIIEEIEKGFFQLPEEILNYDECSDAATTRLTINLEGKAHSVREYCSDNEVYENIVRLVKGYTK
jgi:hypothetical protein|tara:strand:+ start:14193 stop:14621 length:429 start_codon:yes stop_codon:yes gene_type:complete